MRILFVSGIDGFCHRYQVLHRARQVARLGGEATIRHFADPRLVEEAASHDVALFYRVPETAHVVAAIDRARACGGRVLGAIDDLIFVPEEALFPELAAWDADERDLWMDGVRRYRATLERCDAVLAPTEPIVSELASAGMRGILHRNSVSDPELALAREVCAEREGRGTLSPAFRIGYFSGTPTHDRDFAVVAPVLARLLREHRGASLRLFGPVDPGEALAPVASRVECRSLVPWWRLPREVAACDVSLAPLDLTGRFAACKGEIKYLEAAAVGVPVVASPSDAFRHAVGGDENGRLAGSPEEWHEALAALLGDPALRRRLGGAARADVERRFGEAARTRDLALVLEEVGVRSGSRRSLRPGTRPAACRGDREPRLARVALEADAYPGAVAPCEPQTESPPVTDGRSLAQTFRAAVDGLVRVDVFTVTHGRSLAGRLELSLTAEGGSAVASAELPAREVPDRAWIALELPAPSASSGRVFDLTIALVSDDPAAALSLGLGLGAGDHGPARLAGQPLDGALALRAYAAWSGSRDDAARARSRT
jgi:glycosyltransferase involved in cell wall biosynthesis